MKVNSLHGIYKIAKERIRSLALVVERSATSQHARERSVTISINITAGNGDFDIFFPTIGWWTLSTQLTHCVLNIR